MAFIGPTYKVTVVFHIAIRPVLDNNNNNHDWL